MLDAPEPLLRPTLCLNCRPFDFELNFLIAFAPFVLDDSTDVPLANSLGLCDKRNYQRIGKGRSVEGATTFASLVIGVAVTQQLINLHFLLRERKSVRWDFLCLGVAALIQLTIIMIWWGIAGPSDGAITIGQFLPTFVILVVLFLLSAASLPDQADGDARDLRAYYEHNSSYIWSLFLTVTMISTAFELLSNAPSDRPFFNFFLGRILDLLLLPLAMLSLIFVRARWWHLAVLTLLAVGPIGWLSRSVS